MATHDKPKITQRQQARNSEPAEGKTEEQRLQEVANEMAHKGKQRQKQSESGSRIVYSDGHGDIPQP